MSEGVRDCKKFGNHCNRGFTQSLYAGVVSSSYLLVWGLRSGDDGDAANAL